MGVVSRVRTLTTGQEVHLDFDRSRDEAVAALQKATMSRIDDWVESYLPDGRAEPVAGVVTADGFRVSTPLRARAPWWPLTPDFRGRIIETGSGSCRVDGRLVVPRTTVLGATLLLTLPWLAGPHFGTSVTAIFGTASILNVAFALPRTSKGLLRRVSDAMQGSTSSPR